MTTYTILSGQTLSGSTLFSGGTSVGTITLNPGDLLTVANGGIAEALTVTGVTVTVLSGGTTNGLTIGAGTTETVSAGGIIKSNIIANGGLVTETLTAATAKFPTVDTGLSILSGGQLNILGTAVSVTQAQVTVVAGAKIEMAGINATTAAVSSSSTTSTTTLTVSLNGVSESVVLTGVDTVGLSTIGTGTATRDVFTVLTTCFAGGTEILLEAGEAPIESIQAGDKVIVRRDGQDVVEPVTWVGKTRIDLTKHARLELAAPVRIKAGALSENTPVRDLVVSPEHCMIISGRCVPAKLLVNGGSIIREYRTEPFEYYHLELERHGILIAAGAEAESYLDTGNRFAFDNAGLPKMLHPTFEVNAASHRWQTDACAPLASIQEEVAPIWQALADRSAALGYAVAAPATVQDPDLHILADGQRIEPVSDRDARYVFTVPAGTKSVSLVSRFCIPADKMVSTQRDTRRLGVSVNWIAIRSDDSETILSADHPALQDGWNDAEQAGSTMWRWTDGAATIPWDNINGSAVVTVRCTQVDQYPVYDEKLALVA